MDIGALTVFAALFVVLFIHTARRLAQRWSTDWRRMYIFLVIINLAVAGTLVTLEVRHQMLQAQLSRVVQTLAEKPHAAVRCQRFATEFFDASAELGYVAQDKPDVAILRASTCSHLRSYLASDKSAPTRKQVTAVHILTHEAGHLHGKWNESEAECWAIQRNFNTALYLGATMDQAESLAKAYYKDHYPHMPRGYKSRECHEGGELDETPEDGIFP